MRQYSQSKNAIAMRAWRAKNLQKSRDYNNKRDKENYPVRRKQKTEAMRVFRAEHREKLRLKDVERYKNNPARRVKRYVILTPDQKFSRKIYLKCYMNNLKLEVFNKYSNNNIKCACVGCPINYIGFLQLDHVNGDGGEHREKIGLKLGATKFYVYLKNNNFPVEPPLQILCANCNRSKAKNKTCQLYGKSHVD